MNMDASTTVVKSILCVCVCAEEGYIIWPHGFMTGRAEWLCDDMTSMDAGQLGCL